MVRRPSLVALATALIAACACTLACAARPFSDDAQPQLSNERVVFQLEAGDVEFAFFPEVAPVTAAHIFTLVTLGLYTSNHFFRVDKGFVAQVADVAHSRQLPLSPAQREQADRTVPLEVVEGVKHHTGVLSLGRYDDPNSGTSSFSILLGDAPHLDMKYTIFGRVTRGMEVVKGLEALPTRREGIFVMPLQRITIMNSYWYSAAQKPGQIKLTLPQPGGNHDDGDGSCEQRLAALLERFEAVSQEAVDLKRKLLP